MSDLLTGLLIGIYATMIPATAVFWYGNPLPSRDVSQRRLLAESVVCGIAWPYIFAFGLSAVVEEVLSS